MAYDQQDDKSDTGDAKHLQCQLHVYHCYLHSLFHHNSLQCCITAVSMYFYGMTGSLDVQFCSITAERRQVDAVSTERCVLEIVHAGADVP